MFQMRKIGTCIFLVSAVFFAFAVPYNTPTIDGVITISPDDWDADELRGDDPADDSYWGTANDFDDIYLTWDADFIYFGLKYTVSDNGMVLYIEASIDGGVVDFNSTRGYMGAYPRNITFPDSVGIDFFIGSWNGAGPFVYLAADSNSVEITSSCPTATGGNFVQEIAVPWGVIFDDVGGIVPPNLNLKVVGVIVGGDDYGAGDAVPDNPSVDGGEGPNLLTEYVEIPVDEDGDGIPDFSGEAVAGTVFFNDSTFTSPPYPVATISAYDHTSGDFVASAFSSADDGAFLIAGFSVGDDVDIVAEANGFSPDTVENYTVQLGGNFLNFLLEPYSGKIFGNIYPDDFSTVVYAMCDSEVVGFGDTTEIGDGSFEITHLSDGTYDVVVEPSSSDYLNQVIEGVEIDSGSAVELNISLERAGVIREVDDDIGDDYGPGWYSYPTDEVFVDGVFDIEYVKIRDLSTENAYQFEIGVKNIPDASVVDWNPYYPPMNLQKIDIYIDCHSGGARVGLPNRNVSFAATDAWDFAISADGWWVGLLASNGQDIFSNFSQNLDAVQLETDIADNRMFITIDKGALEDDFGFADTSEFDRWDFIILMMGHDGDGVEGVRSVNAGTSNQWNFNNGEEGDADPNVIDMVVMPGVNADGSPKEEGRSQEEMLDYTIQTPVVLEAARSYDITPPTIDFDIPDEMPHLSRTPGVYIEVKIDDDVAVADAYLYWRNVGETEWHTPIPLGYREVTSSYVADLPYEFVLPDSYEFFFYAEDSAGNVTYNPQDYPDSLPPTIPDYPYSPVSANPTRVVPPITDVEASYSIPMNTVLGDYILKFPDGAVLVFNRDAVYD
ncbi:hypothetical protein J7M00_01550, partial [bacterium]|nr:hypothetical protein [bacterium]